MLPRCGDCDPAGSARYEDPPRRAAGSCDGRSRSSARLPKTTLHASSSDHLRSAATCQACGRTLEPGEQARWDPDNRRATCADTTTNQAGVAGRAGESAQTMRDRSRSARKDRARERWGALEGLVVELSDDTASERAWAKGAKGERIVARRLEKLLAGHSVLLRHDRRISGSRANIDHVAIGPGGVTVVEAKHLEGAVRRQTRGGLLRPRSEHLLVGGRDRTSLIDGMHHQLAIVRGIAGDAVGVQGMLCLVDGEGLPLLCDITSTAFPSRAPEAPPSSPAGPDCGHPTRSPRCGTCSPRRCLPTRGTPSTRVETRPTSWTRRRDRG